MTPNSGAGSYKGDMEMPNHLLEAKSTTGTQCGLKHEWLSKIAREARAIGKSPALLISFVTGDGRPKPSGEWVVIPLHEWKLLTGEQSGD
jgi:hypothetical protein